MKLILFDIDGTLEEIMIAARMTVRRMRHVKALFFMSIIPANPE
jgi:hypothetical protein